MKRHQVAKGGQVILSEIWGKKGAIGFVPPEGEGALCTSHFFLFDVDSCRIDQKYLQAIFTANYLQDQLDAEARGTTGYAAVRPKILFDAKIPLPPVDEQRRIVARIEELAARIEEARELRRRAVEEAESVLPSARNKIFGKLSNEFDSVRLDLVSDTRLGKMLSRKSKTGTGSTPYLRNANIQWDYLDLSDVYEMDFTEEERKKLALQSGDILVCEGGDIGKAAIWNNEIAGCCYQKALHRVRVDQTKLIPRFLLHHLFWAAEQGHFADMKTQTTIAHLTGVKLKSYGVFVPSIQEQQIIAAYLDCLQSKIDALRHLQAEDRRRAGRAPSVSAGAGPPGRAVNLSSAQKLII
jgi:type I restriction enzyme S subunit